MQQKNPAAERLIFQHIHSKIYTIYIKKLYTTFNYFTNV